MTKLKNAIKQGTVIKDIEDPSENECSAGNPHLKLVCDEYYRGPYFGFWHDQGWVMDMENCSLATKRTQIKELITVITVYKEDYKDETVVEFGKRFSRDLRDSYTGMMGLITAQTHPSSLDNIHFNNVHIVNFGLASSESAMWYSLIRSARTPYVLVGRSLHTFYGKWANLERSIRLLGSKLMFLFYF